MEGESTCYFEKVVLAWHAWHTETGSGFSCSVSQRRWCVLITFWCLDCYCFQTI